MRHRQPVARDGLARSSLRRELGMWAGYVVGQTGYDGYDGMLSV